MRTPGRFIIILYIYIYINNNKLRGFWWITLPQGAKKPLLMRVFNFPEWWITGG
jgi:hypothetical protein